MIREHEIDNGLGVGVEAEVLVVVAGEGRPDAAAVVQHAGHPVKPGGTSKYVICNKTNRAQENICQYPKRFCILERRNSQHTEYFLPEPVETKLVHPQPQI